MTDVGVQPKEPHLISFTLFLLKVSRLKKELLVCSEDRDSAQLERDLLNNRFKHLESERESERSSQTDRAREIRGLEVRLQWTEGQKLRISREQWRIWPSS